MTAAAPQLDALRRAGQFFDIRREVSLFEVATSLGVEVAEAHAKRRFEAEGFTFPGWLHPITIAAWSQIPNEDVSSERLRGAILEAVDGQPAAVSAFESQGLRPDQLVTAFCLYRGDQVLVEAPESAPSPLAIKTVSTPHRPLARVGMALIPLALGLAAGAFLRTIFVSG